MGVEPDGLKFDYFSKSNSKVNMHFIECRKGTTNTAMQFSNYTQIPEHCKKRAKSVIDLIKIIIIINIYL